jgi:hypothetical protein
MARQEIKNMSMEIIELKKQELDLLVKHSLIENLHTTTQQGNKILLSETKYYFESLLEKLSNLLIKEGIDSKTDEPNELGLKIETLIDIVSRVVYSSK